MRVRHLQEETDEAAMPDGTDAVMIEGKRQDDATRKQARVIADLADLFAAKDRVSQPKERAG